MLGLPAEGQVRHGPLFTEKRPTFPSITWLAVAGPAHSGDQKQRNRGYASEFGLHGETMPLNALSASQSSAS